MKKRMALGWMILFFASFVWAQEKCEAPVWNVGDKWTYKDAAGITWTNQVIDSKGDLFIVKIGGIQELCAFDGGIRDLYGFDKKTLNAKYLIKEGGRRVKYTGRWRETLNFPIFVGKEWTVSTSALSKVYSMEFTLFDDFKIEGIEEVRTAAGTFKAYKISWRESAAGWGNFISDPRYWYRLWYSPEVKTWIKRETWKNRQTGTMWWLKAYEPQDAELISYQLN